MKNADLNDCLKRTAITVIMHTAKRNSALYDSSHSQTLIKISLLLQVDLRIAAAFLLSQG